MMTIGEAAKKAGLPTKTVRYYADIDLVAPDRSASGYRLYGDEHVHQLAFLARARSLGFGIEDCRRLLSLWNDRSRASGDVRRLAARHMEEIGVKIAALEEMRGTLRHLVETCQGDGRPDCPILDSLAGIESGSS